MTEDLALSREKKMSKDGYLAGFEMLGTFIDVMQSGSHNAKDLSIEEKQDVVSILSKDIERLNEMLIDIQKSNKNRPRI